jgi:hypothetical protein
MHKALEPAVREIRRKLSSMPAQDRQAFAALVLDPPATKEGEFLFRDVASPVSRAYWDGYDGTPARGLTPAEKPAREAGRFRRALEDVCKVPRAGAAPRHPETGQPDTSRLPPDLHFGEPGIVRSVAGADGACFALYDRNAGGDWLDADDRWVACRYLPDGTNTGVVSFPTRRLAESALADEKAGRDTGIDWGREDGMPRP